MDKINEALRDQLTQTLQDGVIDEAFAAFRKRLDDAMREIEDDIEYRLKDELAPNLAVFVEEMAKNTVKALLEGNENMMREYLGCRQGAWNGRMDGYSMFGRQRNPEEFHPVIHGKLHENGCVLLRREIAQAHADLITSERILDLEDQVKSLVAQVNKANAAKDAMFECCRNYL